MSLRWTGWFSWNFFRAWIGYNLLKNFLIFKKLAIVFKSCSLWQFFLLLDRLFLNFLFKNEIRFMGRARCIHGMGNILMSWVWYWRKFSFFLSLFKFGLDWIAFFEKIFCYYYYIFWMLLCLIRLFYGNIFFYIFIRILLVWQRGKKAFCGDRNKENTN